MTSEPRPAAGAPRKVLCTVALGSHTELLEIAREPLERYAERHGYVLHVETEVDTDGRPAAWGKVRVLRRLLEDHDIVVWIDADAMLVQDDEDIAELLDDDRFLGLVQHRFDGQDLLNTGVMVWRGEDRARAFLDAVWANESFIEHPWWENAALADLLGYRVSTRPARMELVRPTEWFTGVQLLPLAWNSVAPDAARSPRVKHYAGLSHEVRLQAMGDDLDELRRAQAPRPQATIVLPLSGDPAHAWASLLTFAGLPEEPAHEVVLVDRSGGGLAPLLDLVEGDVTIHRPGRELDYAQAANIALAAPGADVVVLVSGPVAVEPRFLHALLESLANPIVAAASSVADDGVAALAVRRATLLDVGGVPAEAGDGEGLGPLCDRLRLAGHVIRIAADSVVRTAAPPATESPRESAAGIGS
jgi:hypothetical protein